MTSSNLISDQDLRRALKRRFVKWSSLVFAGVAAYGVGIYQGYQSYKHEQSLEFPKQAIESATTPVMESSSPAGKPKNIGSQRSPTAQH